MDFLPSDERGSSQYGTSERQGLCAHDTFATVPVPHSNAQLLNNTAAFSALDSMPSHLEIPSAKQISSFFLNSVLAGP